MRRSGKLRARKAGSGLDKEGKSKDKSSSDGWSSISCGDLPNSCLAKLKLPSRKKIERWKKKNEEFMLFAKKVSGWKKEILAESSTESVSSGSPFDLSELEWEDINYSQEKEMNAWRIEGLKGESTKALDDWVEVPKKEKDSMKQELHDAFKFLKKSRGELKTVPDDKASVSTDLSDMMERCRSVLELDKEADADQVVGGEKEVVPLPKVRAEVRNRKKKTKAKPKSFLEKEFLIKTDQEANVVKGPALTKGTSGRQYKNLTKSSPRDKKTVVQSRQGCNADVVKNMVERSNEPYNLTKRRSELELQLEVNSGQGDGSSKQPEM